MATRLYAYRFFADDGSLIRDAHVQVRAQYLLSGAPCPSCMEPARVSQVLPGGAGWHWLKVFDTSGCSVLLLDVQSNPRQRVTGPRATVGLLLNADKEQSGATPFLIHLSDGKGRPILADAAFSLKGIIRSDGTPTNLKSIVLKPLHHISMGFWLGQFPVYEGLMLVGVTHKDLPADYTISVPATTTPREEALTA